MEINEMPDKFLKEQNEFRSRIKTEDAFDVNEIRLIAGVDLAYWKNENDEEMAVCCIVVIDFKSHKIIEKKHYSGKIAVPYMPGFLAFRELPLCRKQLNFLKMSLISIYLMVMDIFIHGIWESQLMLHFI